MDYGTFLKAFSGDPSLYGGGELLAPVFAEMVGDVIDRDAPRFHRGLEWCCGRGHIGLWLLRSELVDHMMFIDINPDALVAAEAASFNVDRRRRCLFAASDNMSNLLLEAYSNSFDLVVANPPSYCNIPARHPHSLRYDRRPSDLGWKTHARFYRQIPAFLAPGAELFISEVDPWSERIVLPGLGEWDRRPEPPIDTFRTMIEDAGLEWLGCERFTVHDELPVMGMVRARAP